MTQTITAGKLSITVDARGMALSVKTGDRERLSAPAPLFIIEITGLGEFTPACFGEAEVTRGAAGPSELLSLTFRHPDQPITVRADFLAKGDRIDFSLSTAIDWPDVPMETFLRVPPLARFDTPAARYPANPCPKPDGSPALQPHPAFPLPLCIYDETGAGLSVSLGIPWPGLGWDQNRNQDFNRIADAESLANHRVRLRPHEHMAVAFEAGFTALEGGWDEAFARFRADNQRLMDLGEYARSDLRWALENQFHHFTYIFGAEACAGDYTRVNIDALIDAGVAFGGYDALLLWHQYPRLGLDSRSQWAFYDDFPGGKAGLRAAVDRAHARGVKVFLPFKPWDAGLDETPNAAVRAMAELVIDMDVDGIFFDTMDAVPEGLRELIDAGKPGVVFCTESRPQNMRCFEGITCSWDQHWNEYPFPESDLIRFLLPHHASPVIARWHLASRKDLLIKRAVFGGTGIVIWQDVFGAWLPYSDVQKAAIARWKSLFHSLFPLLTSENAVPLIDTAQAGLYANYFPGDREAVVTLASTANVAGPLVSARGYSTAREKWSGRELTIEDGMICGTVSPEDVLVIHLT